MSLDLNGPLEPLTPEWWLRRLLTKLTNTAPHFDALDEYYRGTAPVPVGANKEVKRAYARLMSMSRTNFAELVIDATRERMIPAGFRTGAAGDDNGDKVAWDIWQANTLDADCDLVHTPQLSMGVAYAIVGLGAAAYSPAKYGILTEYLPHRQLVVANGWIEGLTVASIILGTMLGGLLIHVRVSGVLLVAVGVLLVTDSLAVLARWFAETFPILNRIG